MTPLETLKNEHGLIRQYLNKLGQAAEHIENGRRPAPEFFEKAVDFARSFTDSYHHFKEEHVLFLRMAQHKRGEIDAQLETLRQQHERGREMVNAISNAIEGYAAEDPMKTAEILENIAAYSALLKHHIFLEDHTFYPMADETLSEEEMKILAGEFDKQKAKHGGDTFERCHKLVVDMSSIVVHLGLEK